MNSPRSLISTSSSGGIGIGIEVAVEVAVSELVQRTRRSADPISVLLRLQQCRMSHVARSAGQLCAATVAATAAEWRPRVITQSLIQMPGHRHRSAIAPRLPIVPPPFPLHPPFLLLCLALALMLMHVRVPDIIVVRGSVCRSLSARASASASTRCGQWGTP